jgi:hypothetical protein
LLSPVFVAILPSKLMAAFNVTKGRFSLIKWRKKGLSALASLSRTPTSTSIPAFFIISIPLPLTSGFESRDATTARLIPFWIISSAHGGVFP